MNKRLSLKIIGMVLAFFISVFLSSLITFCLMQIFLKQPEEILKIDVFRILETVGFSGSIVLIPNTLLNSFFPNHQTEPCCVCF